jgi:hypothetical protein
MHEPDEPAGRRGLQTPKRNRYFHGQLLNVHDFELETDYSIRQRRLLNRLVLGHCVICGLNVEVTGDGRNVVLWPGLAIDRRGREIIVAQRSAPIPIPPAVIQSAAERALDERDEACVQMVICYHECHGDPVPVRAGDCELTTRAPPAPCWSSTASSSATDAPATHSRSATSRT